jgi:hypothetical protein
VERPESGLGAVGLLALAGVGVVIALFLLRAVVGVGIGGGDDPAPAGEVAKAVATDLVPAVSTSSAVQGSTDTTGPAAVPVAVEPYVPDRFTPSYPAVGDLDDGSVLQLDLAGFAANVTGVIQQCIYADGDQRECRRPLPVNLNGDGRARVQYQLTQSVSPALTSCTGYVRPCYVSVDDGVGGRALLMTVFDGPLPDPGEITVSRRADLRPGEEVEVRVSGFPPRARVYAVQCSPPWEWGPLTCDGPGPEAAMTIGADGTARATVTVTEGRLGTDGGSCPPSARCGISVASDDVWARAAVVPLTFRGADGARYDLGRTLLALAVCIALVVVAWWLWRRTDWDGPTEAATPEMDAATLE